MRPKIVYDRNRREADYCIHTADAVPDEDGEIEGGGIVGASEYILLDDEDAEFIVRAWNCHDELLEALKRLASYGDIFGYKESERNPYEQAMEAITKAEQTQTESPWWRKS